MVAIKQYRSTRICRHDRSRPPGIRRRLLLGDSFAHGNGVQTSATWAEIADAALTSTEIVNLGVDGYGMAQAYLRYRSLATDIEHRGAIMMFVPTADLWRDVNTLRDLVEPWNIQTVMPRYSIEQDELSLIPSPYRNPPDVYADNRQEMTATLREHLRRNDRFYLAPLFEPTALVGNLLTYKVIVAAYARLAARFRRHGLMKPGSEAMRISHGIFVTLNDDLRHQSKDFYLLILPTPYDLVLSRQSPAHVNKWQRMVAATCPGIPRCIDLAPALSRIALARN